jgi:hypothetical protein
LLFRVPALGSRFRAQDNRAICAARGQPIGRSISLSRQSATGTVEPSDSREVNGGSTAIFPTGFEKRSQVPVIPGFSTEAAESPRPGRRGRHRQGMFDLLVGVLVGPQDRQRVLVHNHITEADKLIAEQHGEVMAASRLIEIMTFSLFI